MSTSTPYVVNHLTLAIELLDPDARLFHDRIQGPGASSSADELGGSGTNGGSMLVGVAAATGLVPSLTLFRS